MSAVFLLLVVGGMTMRAGLYQERGAWGGCGADTSFLRAAFYSTESADACTSDFCLVACIASVRQEDIYMQVIEDAPSLCLKLNFSLIKLLAFSTLASLSTSSSLPRLLEQG